VKVEPLLGESLRELAEDVGRPLLKLDIGCFALRFSERDQQPRTQVEQADDEIGSPGPLGSSERLAALCGLDEAQRDQGNPEFRSTLLEAGRLAKASGDVPLLVRAALANSRGLPSVIGAVDADRVAITEAALEAVDPQPTAERARLLAQWGWRPPSGPSLSWFDT
jgi:hypothetical protein